MNDKKRPIPISEGMEKRGGLKNPPKQQRPSAPSAQKPVSQGPANLQPPKDRS